MSSFNPKQYLIKVQGRQLYLPVAARLIWFRQERPDWSIETEPLHLDLENGVSIYRATIRDENGRIRAQATKMETRKDFFDFIEKSETGALGRALAMCGYGTQFTNEFDEGARIVDSPQAPSEPVYTSPKPLEDPFAEEPTTNDPFEETSNTTEALKLCADCSKPLTAGQYQYSTRKFQRPLCPACQKKQNG